MPSSTGCTATAAIRKRKPKTRKCLHLVTRSLDPTGTGRTKWAMRWKPALNVFAITFGDRFPAAETY
jgi:putative transposase